MRRLSGWREMQLDAGSPSPGPSLSILRTAGREFSRAAGLRSILPAAGRVLGVVEPAGRVSIKALPSDDVAASGNGHLTVMSANLWHDWPRHRRWTERLERFARRVEAEEADVLLLQEIARTSRLRGDEWLARRLGMACAYSRANGHERGIGFEEGLAVFSRFPLTSPRVRDLMAVSRPFVRRLALGAAVETPFGPVLVFSVHLSLRQRRNAAQLSRLRSWVAEVAAGQAALIGGDFNATETASQIVSAQSAWTDTFRHLHPTAEAVTHESRWPWGWQVKRRRLDYIFLQPGEHSWSVLEAHHVETPDGPYSDHRTVLVRLAPPAEASPPPP